MPHQTHKVTPAEKGFWKDAFLAAAHSDALVDVLPEEASAHCANFADAALKEYRQRIIWRKP